MKIEAYTEKELSSALGERVARDLRSAIEIRGRASIAVPGGSTPGPFLMALAAQPLDWKKITVTLTDERQVPADHARSNARLVAQTLLQGDAKAATFVPLYSDDQKLDDVAMSLADTALPLDVCVLGMGDDMHTASLFPGTSGLSALLDPHGTDVVAAVTPPGADEPRVSLTAKALANAGYTYLLIKGATKRAALDRAMQTENREAAPIRAILDTARAPVVFYTDQSDARST